jgi:hypothetical protein
MVGDALTGAAEVADRAHRFAIERHLPSARRFFESVAAPGDRTLLVLGGAGTDPGELSHWLVRHGPATKLLPDRLECLVSDPGPALAANRVLVALRCGRLLDPDAVEAAAVVTTRPPGSYVIVLTGAEEIRDDADLDVVCRGLWRVLLGDEDEVWSGQDLATRGCLLWSDQPVGGPVARWVARDAGRLDQWVRDDVATSEALTTLRVRHALDLAERDLAARGPSARASVRRGDVAALREAVADLRARLLRRLDTDLAGLERRITASLRILEQNFIGDIGAHLAAQHPVTLADEALRAAVLAYVSDGVRTWRAEVVRLVTSRLLRNREETADLLDGVDWDLVNATLAGSGYPGLITERLAPPGPVSVPGLDSLSGPGAPAAGEACWAATLRTAAYGGVAVAASLVVLGPLVLPAVTAGALAAAGGTALDMKIGGQRARDAALDYARAAIAATMADFQRTVRDQVRESTQPIRHAVRAEFTVLDTALAAAATRPATTVASAQPPGRAEDAVVVAQLRADLIEDPQGV